MKLINYDFKNQRLYISRPVMVGLILSGLTLLGLFIFWLIFLYAFSTTQYSFDNRTLGQVPEALQKSANDPERAAQLLVATREAKYGNTFNILFFLDGYKKSEEGVVFTNTLKTVLSKDPYFRKLLPQISTTVFTGEGNKCRLEKAELVCDSRALKAFAGLGIPHVKIVFMSPLNFKMQADQAYGRDSFIFLSSADKNNLGPQFVEGLKKAISMDMQSEAYQEQYLTGVLYCFYGGKESYIYPDGKFNSCPDFMKKYPKFWEE